MRWRRRRRPTRTELIDKKHTLEGEISGVAADVQRAQRLGRNTGELETRLTRLRDEHYQTRLAIDRAELTD